MKATDKVFIRIDAIKTPPKAGGIYNTNRGVCKYLANSGAWRLIDGVSPNLLMTDVYVMPAWWLLESTVQDIINELTIPLESIK